MMYSSALKRACSTSLLRQCAVGALALSGVLAIAPQAGAQVVGDTAVLEVLAEGLATPTTVAIKDGVAIVPEGQLARLGVLGGLFGTKAIALDGSGFVNDRNLRFNLPTNKFFPEGIALDAATQDLFIGSIFTGQVEKFSGGVRSRFIAPAPNDTLLRGALGMKVDNDRNLVWVCDSNLGADPARPGATLVGVSLADASAVVRHELPPDRLCNDMTLNAAGDIFIAETFVGEIFKVDSANALIDNSAVSILQVDEIAPPNAGELGANGVALFGDILIVSNTFAGTLVRVDLTLDDPADGVTVVAITEGDDPNAILSGPDGLLVLSDTELLVVNNGFAGAGLEQLVKITFDLQ